MTDDRYGDGYRAARDFYLGQAALAHRAASAWADPTKREHAAVIRRVWPDLADALDAIKGDTP